MDMKIPDSLKRALLHVNRFIGTLERRGVITFQDRIRLLAPRYPQSIRQGQEGHDCITRLIEQGRPFMLSRLGGVELACVRFYLEHRNGRNNAYPRKIKYTIANNAGFFPVDDASLDAFSRLYLAGIEHADAMTVYLHRYEDVLVNRYCPNAALLHPTCIEPFWFTDPWSSRLAGKKVLVIYPFAESIRKQYTEKRPFLFSSPDILPEFDLKTLKAVQSIAGTTVDFTTWFDAYRYMCNEIASVDFDICLIGAGAYGLPLASFARQLGKQAIHMGGMTQVLFGIKGKRWEVFYDDTIATLFNEHWVRPLESETPERKDKVENGCYW